MKDIVAIVQVRGIYNWDKTHDDDFSSSALLSAVQ